MINKITQAIRPPVFDDDPIKNRDVGFLNTVLWTIFFGSILAIPIVITAASENVYNRLLPTLAALMMALLLIYLMHHGYIRVVKIITFLGLWAIVNLTILIGGGAHVQSHCLSRQHYCCPNCWHPHGFTRSF